MKNPFNELQKYIKKNKIDYLLIDTFDPHGSEYINDHYKVRQQFSGFTGSNGLLLVSQKESYLWTDGRYFIQAENELYKNIKLMKMGEKNVPTIYEFLNKVLHKDMVLAADQSLISSAMGNKLSEICENTKAIFENDGNFIDNLWDERPKNKFSKPYILENEFAGESALSKIKKIQKKLKKDKSVLFLSKLDEIMWLLNIRGNDIECNPVCYSYVFMTDKDVHLFINKKSLSSELKSYFNQLNINIYDYTKTKNDIEKIISKYKFDTLNIDQRFLSYYFYNVLSKYNTTNKPSEIDRLKAIKNKTEIKNIKECYLEDSAVLTKFIKYLKEHNTISELEAASVIDKMRSKIPGFLGLSFPTISAYGPNAAMMHYEATKDNYSNLKPEGLYLVDSGGQYYKGTTDVTRTIVLGPVNENMKKHFTLTAVAMLRLMNTVFMDGCTGRNLDIISREVMWKHGIDYKCGTGHGIGYLLNVHEGPHNIGWQKRINNIEPKLEKGMIVSDEPGVYIQGEYGIRTENIVIVDDYKSTSDGHFLHFVPLTYVPIDLEAIDTQYMNDDDIQLLNNYHTLCFKKLKPFMNAKEIVWLKNITKKICK